MPLIIRSSLIHHAGCYTTAAISQGAHVVEYTGRRITIEEGDRLYEGKEITYLFGLEDGEHVIDGYGTAMFINHSCAPNCTTEEIGGRVWIVALRDIAPGEELTYVLHALRRRRRRTLLLRRQELSRHDVCARGGPPEKAQGREIGAGTAEIASEIAEEGGVKKVRSQK